MEERIIISRKSNQASMVVFIVLSILGFLVSMLYFIDEKPTHGLVTLIVGAVFVVFALVSSFLTSEIVVTNKRVTGTAPFGSQIDIPLDSISAIATFNHFIFFHGVVVGTSAGKIKFYRIFEAKTVFEELRNQLIATQNDSESDEYDDSYYYNYDYSYYNDYYYYPRRRKPIDFGTYRNGKPVKPRLPKPRVPRYH